MEEATLLTVVTLRPTDKKYLTVTIQPLLCSDMLHLGTDRGQSRPLEALHTDAECLGEYRAALFGYSDFRRIQTYFRTKFEAWQSDCVNDFALLHQSENGTCEAAIFPARI